MAKKNQTEKFIWWMKFRQILWNFLTFGIAWLIRYIKDRKVAKNEF